MKNKFKLSSSIKRPTSYLVRILHSITEMLNMF